MIINSDLGMAMAMTSGDRGKVLQGLVQSLQQCVEAEAWGLRVEAAEEGQKSVRKLRQAAAADNHCFTAEEKDLFLRMSHGLQLRASSLQVQDTFEDSYTPWGDLLTTDMIPHPTQDLSSVQESSSEDSVDVKRFTSALESLLSGSASAEELASRLAGMLPQPQSSGLQLPERSRSLPLSEECSTAVVGKGGSLVHRGTMQPGCTYVTITIDKIGLKNPHNYIDPFITVSVKNHLGVDVESPQDTPVASQREVSYIVFGVPVEIQYPVGEIPHGSAIFFEFKHFKPKKRSTSTCCFSFMEMDEIRPGKAFLEIYKKPTDFCRKKLSLLSIKPLYLHLTLELRNT